MTVYVDLLFGLNTFLNYLLLRGAAAMGGVGKRTGRLVGAAAVGGLYAVLTLLPGLAVLAKLPGQGRRSGGHGGAGLRLAQEQREAGALFSGAELRPQRRGAPGGGAPGAGFKALGRKSLLRRLHPGAPSAGGAELRPGGTGAPGRGQAHRRRPHRSHPHFGGANGDPPGAPGHGQHSLRPPHRRGRGGGRARRPCGAAPRLEGDRGRAPGSRRAAAAAGKAVSRRPAAPGALPRRGRGGGAFAGAPVPGGEAAVLVAFSPTAVGGQGAYNALLGGQEA